MLETVGIIPLDALLPMAAHEPYALAIERSIVVSTPAKVIHARMVDLHQWNLWSPYEMFDPRRQKEFNGTHVTWNTRGPNRFVAKGAAMFMNSDAMIGKDGDDGLASVKTQEVAK